jgi:mycofactocin precursor
VIADVRQTSGESTRSDVEPIGREGAQSQAASESGLSEDEARESMSALVVEDLLVEDVSIDGMCGVY